MLFHLIFAEESSEFAGGNKILELHDDQGRDYTFLVDYNRCYFSTTEIREQIAGKLDVDISEIEIEEV